MIRSIWKGKFIYFDILYESKYEDIILLKNKNIFLFPELLGLKFYVYNGYTWFNIIVDNLLLNFNLGCFLFTRAFDITHNLKKMKKILHTKKTLALKKKKLIKKKKK